MSTVLSIEKLNKRFGGVVVADNIDLQLGAGEVVGLIGPNGAGKTTLFNLISGVIPADAGRISLAGKRLDALPVYRRARHGVARTWQHMRLFQSMSVLDNLLVAGSAYPGESFWRLIVAGSAVKAAEAHNRDKAHAVLSRMGLAALASANVADITFGQQKLIGLARALMSDSPLLLLDEPMAGVEGSAYDTMREIVAEEAAAGRAICVVEHNVSFIRALCTSAIFMVRGRIVERGGVEALLESRALAELYFGK
ncbi:MAG TPA: ATP-binding cassette domain-containing protein [Paraburkholderia sp.]|jgi:ABC-type branched-subunit amino acid transport system ATPase component